MAPFDLQKTLSGLANETVEGLQSFLASSLSWSGDQLSKLSDSPLVDKTGFAGTLKGLSGTLSEAGNDPGAVIQNTIQRAQEAMRIALESMNVAEETIRSTLFSSIEVSSVIGPSFVGLKNFDEIKPSLRLDSENVSADDIAADFKNGSYKAYAVLIPGLFCDETIWTRQEKSIADTLKSAGVYPVLVRLNPVSRIYENGRVIAELFETLKQVDIFHEHECYVITYSQGGLILRSALDQKPELSEIIKHAVMISSPDGGSYLEKLGLWLGMGLNHLPQPLLNMIGYIGKERGNLFQDMANGSVRKDTTDQYYFGELDKIQATQIFSLISMTNHVWEAWIGDGYIEEPSLTRLTAEVFLEKPGKDNRSRVIPGRSHFQILDAPELRDILTGVIS